MALLFTDPGPFPKLTLRDAVEPMFDIIEAGPHKIIKAWKRGVKFDEKTIGQLQNTAQLPFIFKWVAAMPDAHFGIGATIGTVMPTKDAIVPAAVGVDLGCGMLAMQLELQRAAIPDSTLPLLRKAIEKAVPHGRTNNGQRGDRGAWHDIPDVVQHVWDVEFSADYIHLIEKHPGAAAHNTVRHFGTLGTGNHFIELCADEDGYVWILLHSGSRGMGNKIGTYFTSVAKEKCKRWFINLPDPDLAFLARDEPEFADYLHAVKLAQKFAWMNREYMAGSIYGALREVGFHLPAPRFTVHCHHNYIAWENHFDENVMVTRKGAVRAALGDFGIIPGSMGARTYIVRGLGSPHSFHSCSHGAGRTMGRREAERRFTVADHVKATEGVECIKDASVLDETPGAYKPIDDVIAAQRDLVEPVARLKQFVCVKGGSDR